MAFPKTGKLYVSKLIKPSWIRKNIKPNTARKNLFMRNTNAS